MSCLISKELGLKLSSIFGKGVTLSSQSERHLLKRKRKEQLLEEKQKGSAVGAARIVPKGPVEDIFADVGRYMPVGMLEEGEVDSAAAAGIEESEHTTAVTGSVSASETETGKAKVKGLFSNLLPSFPTKIKMAESSAPSPQKIVTKNNAACVFEDSDNEDNEIIEKDKVKGKDTGADKREMDKNSAELEGDNKKISGVEGDLMAPIRAMLAAQAIKEQAALARSEARASASSEGATYTLSIIATRQFNCAVLYFVLRSTALHSATVSHVDSEMREQGALLPAQESSSASSAAPGHTLCELRLLHSDLTLTLTLTLTLPLLSLCPPPAGHRGAADKDKNKFSSLAVGADGKSRVHRDVFGVVGNTGAMGCVCAATRRHLPPLCSVLEHCFHLLAVICTFNHQFAYFLPLDLSFFEDNSREYSYCFTCPI